MWISEERGKKKELQLYRKTPKGCKHQPAGTAPGMWQRHKTAAPEQKSDVRKKSSAEYAQFGQNGRPQADETNIQRQPCGQ
jgi:hypothetical protein